MSRDNSRRSNSSNSRDGGRNKKSGRPTNSSRSNNRSASGSKFSGPSSGGSRSNGPSQERGGSSRPSGSRPSGSRSSERPSFGGGQERGGSGRPTGNRPSGNFSGGSRPSRGPGGPKKFGARREDREDRHIPKTKGNIEGDRGAVRLNRFIANAGICSRREADDLIQAGLVEVNGKVIQEMGYKVSPRDKVRFNGSEIRREKKVYFVLNKPKGFITTTSDPKARKTVMELMSQTGPERIYPVGRLDRQTTGVLLFTNDGDFAKRLTHPSHGARKIYDVTLDKNLDLKDFHAIAAGIELTDGPIKVDDIAFVEGKDRNHVGVVLHSGRNRIVRRIFEHLGYEVVKLDRTVFAGVTKKNLRRGQWRKLSPKEVDTLMMQ